MGPKSSLPLPSPRQSVVVGASELRVLEYVLTVNLINWMMRLFRVERQAARTGILLVCVKRPRFKRAWKMELQPQTERKFKDEKREERLHRLARGHVHCGRQRSRTC